MEGVEEVKRVLRSVQILASAKYKQLQNLCGSIPRPPFKHSTLPALAILGQQSFERS